MRARFLLPFEPIDRLPSSPAPRVVRPGRWRRAVRRVLADATPSWTCLRTAAQSNLTLIPYQLEPALALVCGHGCRFLLADEVGLGKTVQAGVMMAEVLARRPDARALVIAPAALRDQWRHELSARFRLDADVLDAAGIARIAADLPPAINPWSASADRRDVDRLHQAAGGDAIDRDADLGLRRLRRGAQPCRPIGSRHRGAGGGATLACRCAPHGDASFRRRGGVPEAVRHRRHAHRLSAPDLQADTRRRRPRGPSSNHREAGAADDGRSSRCTPRSWHTPGARGPRRQETRPMAQGSR